MSTPVNQMTMAAGLGALAPQSRSQTLLAMLQKEFPNYHPVLAMARIAHDKDASLALQLEAHKSIVKYIEPELKSVEVRNASDARLVRVSLFEPVTLDADGNVLEQNPDGRNW